MYPRVWKRNPRMRGQGNAERYGGSEEGGGNRSPWMSKLPFWVCFWISRSPRNVLNWYLNFLNRFEYAFECPESPRTFWIDFWTPCNILSMFLSLQSTRVGACPLLFELGTLPSRCGYRVESMFFSLQSSQKSMFLSLQGQFGEFLRKLYYSPNCPWVCFLISRAPRDADKFSRDMQTCNRSR